MSATHLAVLAGSGDLAREVATVAATWPGKVTVVPLAGAGAGGGESVADPMAVIARLAGAAVSHAVMVGRVDLPAAARQGIAAAGERTELGDLGLMAIAQQLFARAGITLIGAHEVAPHLLAQRGRIAGPDAAGFLRAGLAEQAIQAARAIGRLDLGQAIVVSAGRAIAAEDAGGTDDLLRRVAALRAAGLAGGRGEELVLAKALKPGQPSFVDLPTIGPETVRLAAAAGIAAIVVEAGHSLIVGRNEVEQLAAELQVAVIGASADD